MFKVKMIRGDGFTDNEWERELEAAYWWAKAWNDLGFQDSVKNFKRTVTTCTGFWRWKKCTTTEVPSRFSYTDDSNDQVLSTMLSGVETLDPVQDGEADVTVVVANQKGVCGWTYANVLTEWISKWFLDGSTIADLADNRAHEWLHKAGYDHPSKRTWDRDWSVPYGVGYLTSGWVDAHFVSGEYLSAPTRAPAPKLEIESVV